jgi:hypothetical protein
LRSNQVAAMWLNSKKKSTGEAERAPTVAAVAQVASMTTR